MNKPRRGAFVLGLVVGLLLGLALALGVALYITKAPVPFLNKVPGRTAEQDSAEVERNRNWDPNAPLAGKNAIRPADAGAPAAVPASAPGMPLRPAPGATAGGAPGAVPAVPAGQPVAPAGSAARPGARDPAALLSGGAPAPQSTAPASDPFVYFVQAGAFTRVEDAEQQRARLALMGQAAKITEREQSGRTVYRVRMGPYPTREDADALQVKLQGAGVESQIVRVEKA